jgi:hypothetical protein
MRKIGWRFGVHQALNPSTLLTFELQLPTKESSIAFGMNEPSDYLLEYFLRDMSVHIAHF